MCHDCHKIVEMIGPKIAARKAAIPRCGIISTIIGPQSGYNVEIQKAPILAASRGKWGRIRRSKRKNGRSKEKGIRGDDTRMHFVNPVAGIAGVPGRRPSAKAAVLHPPTHRYAVRGPYCARCAGLPLTAQRSRVPKTRGADLAKSSPAPCDI